MENKSYIGIDPSFRENGFCISIINNGIVNFIVCKTFIDFYEWLMLLSGDCIFAVENSYMQNLSFDINGSKLVVAKKARNVGMNQAVSQLCVEFIKYQGYEVLEISPLVKGKKLDNNLFLSLVKNNNHELVNYKGNKTEQDKRDAYKLALFAIRGKNKIL